MAKTTHSEQGQPTILHATDWIDQDDPDNPRNFSLTRKVLSTLVFTLLAFVSTLAASMYSAGVSDVMRDFRVSEEVALIPLSSFNLGLALGPLIGSPLSETAGRKAVILVTTPVFALFTMGSGFSSDIVSLSICRFFAGVFAAPAISNAGATISDYTAGRYRAITLSFYYAVPTFGAVLAPLLGGFIVLARGWRWTQWTIIFIIIACFVPVLFVKETYKKTILQRRAKRLHIEGPPVVERTLTESIRHFTTILILRPVHMLLTEPIVSFVCLYIGFLFGLLYTFIVSSPWIYAHYYNFDVAAQSLSFLGLIVGTISSIVPLMLLDYWLYQPRLKKFRETHPPEEQFPSEFRLYPAMIASPLLPTFLLIFAWTAENRVHWIGPIVAQGCVMCTSCMIYTSSNIFMMDFYGPLYGASAAGAAMLSRYALSTAFPLFSQQMYRALGAGWATTVLAGVTILMAPIPWVFYYNGERIRRATKYETSA